MLVLSACGLMLLVGVALSYRWRSYFLAQPEWATRDLRTSSDGADRPWLQLLWLTSVGILTGFTVGALVIGPGGRLVMRLLAATSPESKGFQTEAQETVDRITLGGTIGFIIFVGLAFGVAAGLTYVFVYFALPRGITGGVVFGAALLVVFGSHVDPLRAGNHDFTIVGPGWLAVSAFTTLAVLTGAAIAPVAGRIAAALPAPRASWVWWLVPTALFTLLVFAALPVALVIPVLGSAVFLSAAANRRLRELLRRRGKTVAVVVLAGVVLVSLPAFLSAVDDIVTIP
jgi:hypothetical protein